MRTLMLMVIRVTGLKPGTENGDEKLRISVGQSRLVPPVAYV